MLCPTQLQRMYAHTCMRANTSCMALNTCMHAQMPELAACHMEAEAHGHGQGCGAHKDKPTTAREAFLEDSMAEQLAAHPPTSQVRAVAHGLRRVLGFSGLCGAMGCGLLGV